jgi:hypothetical protein
MPVEIDGWLFTLFKDCGTLGYCEDCGSSDGRVGTVENWHRYGTDPVELLSSWEREQLERLLNALCPCATIHSQATRSHQILLLLRCPFFYGGIPMPNSDLLPSLLFKINENQQALEAAIMELTLWVEQRGSSEVGGNVRGALDTIRTNEEFINMTLAVLMAPE